MIERLAQAIKACKNFAAKNDVRYYINGVALYTHGETISSVVATDGHCMAVVGDLELNRDAEVYIVGNEHIPVLLLALQGLPAGTSTINGMRIEGCKMHIGDYTIPLIDGRFPDARRVIPVKKRNTSEEIGLQPDYLAKLKPFKSELCKHLKTKDRNFVGTTMRAGGANEAVRFDFTNGKVDPAMVIINPMRL